MKTIKHWLCEVLFYVMRLVACVLPGFHPRYGFVLFFGGSSSQDQETSYTDNRNAVQGDGGVSGSGNSLSIVKTDGGAVARALDSIDIANANAGKSFENLLKASVAMFNTSSTAVSDGLVNAYSTAQADKAGSLDNRTIVILSGLAAVVIGVFIWGTKK